MVKNRVCGRNVHSTTLLIYSLNCQFHGLYDKSLSRVLKFRKYGMMQH